MFNFDYMAKEDIKEHNPNWQELPDHLYWILIIGGSRSGKTNALLNLINHEPDIDKIYLYAKDLCEAKNQLIINKRESTGFKKLNDSKIQKLLWNTKMIWIFIKILTDKIQIKRKNINRIWRYDCWYD